MDPDQVVGLLIVAFALGLLVGSRLGSAHYKAKYRESVARESLHLMGPLAMWGPLDEGTPIADALSFELWDAQMEGEQ